MKIYLASGWFNDEQMHVCTSLENFLDGLNFELFNITSEERKIIEQTLKEKSKW